jgi:hypothetical protein
MVDWLVIKSANNRICHYYLLPVIILFKYHAIRPLFYIIFFYRIFR